MASRKNTATKSPAQQLTELAAKLLKLRPINREACVKVLGTTGVTPTSDERERLRTAYVLAGTVAEPVTVAKWFEAGSRSEVSLAVKEGMKVADVRAEFEGAKLVSAGKLERSPSQLRYTVPKFGSLVIIPTESGEVAELRLEGEPVKGPDGRKRLLPDGFVYGGYTFKHGGRVRIDSQAGTIKPTDSGHSSEVLTSPSHVGTLLSNESFVARVRWDAQSWAELKGRRSVKLGVFESSIHADYLQPL